MKKKNLLCITNNTYISTNLSIREITKCKLMIQIMKNKTFILIIFLCFLPLFCKGQFCKLYSTHGDISSSMINHIYQDSKGYIWVSTEDGLNKYDGAKFVNYKNHFNDSTSLLGNHVYRTFQDAKGNLYVLSIKGLQIYN